MATRILTWHFTNGSTDVPSYYMERDYEPVECVIMGKFSSTVEVTVNILDDEETVLNSLTHLGIDQTIDEMAGDFVEGTVHEKGSVITCTATSKGGANGTTVHYEVQTIDD